MKYPLKMKTRVRRSFSPVLCVCVSERANEWVCVCVWGLACCLLWVTPPHQLHPSPPLLLRQRQLPGPKEMKDKDEGEAESQKSNLGFSLRLTHGLILMSWDKNVGTTSKTVFTVCRADPITPRSEGSPGPNPRQSRSVYLVMWRKNHTHTPATYDTDGLKGPNAFLEQQVHVLEKPGSSVQWQTD